MSLLFFDAKFTGFRKDTTFISLGIVSDNGKKFYAEFTDYNVEQCDEWIKENIIKNLVLNPIPYHSNVEEELEKKEKEGYVIARNPEVPFHGAIISYSFSNEYEKGSINCVGTSGWVHCELKEWLSQFDSIHFVSDECHYDFVLLIDLITGGKTALDLPDNISKTCYDIDSDITKYYRIWEEEEFSMSREEIVLDLCGHEIEGVKHNALHDAEMIKAIWEEI